MCDITCNSCGERHIIGQEIRPETRAETLSETETQVTISTTTSHHLTDDPLIFPLAQHAGQCFHLSCEICQHLMDGLMQNLVQTLI